jgi:deoxycytidylate deaminase
MRFLTEKEKEEMEKYVLEAAKEAKKSTCRKSQRGAVIVKNAKTIGRGHNKVTIDDFCNPCIREDIKDNSRVELCSAIHAEQMAILDALRRNEDLKGSRLIHVKVKDGKIRPTKDVSCTVCSRIIIESGISEIVLVEEGGFALYSPEEFNKKSFEHFIK